MDYKKRKALAFKLASILETVTREDGSTEAIRLCEEVIGYAETIGAEFESDGSDRVMVYLDGSLVG